MVAAAAAERGRSEVEEDQAYEVVVSRNGWVHWQGASDIALGVHRPGGGGGDTGHSEGEEVAYVWG